MRFIPLCTPGGESVSHIGLFVRIKKNKLSHKKASSGGICLLQDYRPPMKKFTSPRLLETFKPRLDEDMYSIEEEHSENEKTNSTKGITDSSSTDLLQSQPTVTHKDAAMQCIVEIHPT